MDPTTSFRKALLRRLLNVVGVAAIASPALSVGCGGKVIFDGDGNSSGQGGAGGGSSSNTGSGTGGADGGTCELTSTGTGGDVKQLTACFAPSGDKCPNQYNAAMFIALPDCGYLVSVDCGPVVEGGNCCYLIKEQPQVCPPGGRPFFIGEEARTAAAAPGDRGWGEGEAPPSTADLDAAERAALAEAWTSAALDEHASIASFSRFSLELMAMGAPADLVAQAHRAALDEVRHARLCFALAEGYRGHAIAPSRFPFGASVDLSSDLATLAAATAREGCIGETVSALIAAEQLARAQDPAVRRALAAIAEDEARHAELAWRTVAWAIEEGGEDVRAAVREVFGNAARHLSFAPRAPSGIAPEIAAAHGQLDAEITRQAVVRALVEVILPCEGVLLSRSAVEVPPSGVRSSPLPRGDEVSPDTQRSRC
jgi:hypothetical protein